MRLLASMLLLLYPALAFPAELSCRQSLAPVTSGGFAETYRAWTKNSLLERGTFDLSENDLRRYYEANPLTGSFLRLDRPLTEERQLYKLSDRGEFQAQNWYGYSRDLKSQQNRWSIDVAAFNSSESASSFNEAKINFFSRLRFSMQTFEHEKPYPFMREWGGLNHPPLESLSGRELRTFSKNYERIDYQSPALDKALYFDPSFHEKLDKASASELTSGNKFALIADHESYLAKLNLIKEAKKSIWVTSLLFVDDAPTRELVRWLIRRSHEGLDVKVIVENSLRYVHPALVKEMREAGVRVVIADDFFKYNSQSIYHSKVMLADGTKGIMGGQNMIDADLASKGTDFKNRDLDILVTGPVTTDMAFHFMEDWNHFGEKKKLFGQNQNILPFSANDFDVTEAQRSTERAQGARGSAHYATWLSDREKRMSGLARYVAQKPYKDLSVITNSLLLHIDGIKRYFGLTVPQALDTYKEKQSSRGLKPIHNVYTNFNRLFDRIQKLAKENPTIDVDYITSGANFGLNEAVPMTTDRIRRYVDRGAYVRANLNQVWMDHANLYVARDAYENLIKDYSPYPNVNTWIHVSFIHSKIYYFDRLAVSLGSFNLHHNATDHAYEVTMFIQDAELNRSLDEAMVLDMANSVPLKYKSLVRKDAPGSNEPKPKTGFEGR